MLEAACEHGSALTVRALLLPPPYCRWRHRHPGGGAVLQPRSRAGGGLRTLPAAGRGGRQATWALVVRSVHAPCPCRGRQRRACQVAELGNMRMCEWRPALLQPTPHVLAPLPHPAAGHGQEPGAQRPRHRGADRSVSQRSSAGPGSGVAVGRLARAGGLGRTSLGGAGPRRRRIVPAHQGVARLGARVQGGHCVLWLALRARCPLNREAPALGGILADGVGSKLERPPAPALLPARLPARQPPASCTLSRRLPCCRVRRRWRLPRPRSSFRPSRCGLPAWPGSCWAGRSWGR